MSENPKLDDFVDVEVGVIKQDQVQTSCDMSSHDGMFVRVICVLCNWKSKLSKTKFGTLLRQVGNNKG